MRHEHLSAFEQQGLGCRVQGLGACILAGVRACLCVPILSQTQGTLTTEIITSLISSTVNIGIVTAVIVIIVAVIIIAFFFYIIIVIVIYDFLLLLLGACSRGDYRARSWALSVAGHKTNHNLY